MSLNQQIEATESKLNALQYSVNVERRHGSFMHQIGAINKYDASIIRLVAREELADIVNNELLLLRQIKKRTVTTSTPITLNHS